MALAFRHVESGTVTITEDPGDYDAPDWEALPDPPADDGRWTWDGAAWLQDPTGALIYIRAERDRRLLATDWTQLLDVPEATREAWQPYRQALRDMPEIDDPFAPDWPVPPA